MPLRVMHWLAIPFRWLFQEHKTRGDHRSGVRTRARLEARACEALEGRVVLSGWDNSLAESLTNVGVVVTPIVAADRTNDPSAGRDAPLAQLQADEQALQAELHGLAAKSRATVADLGNLDSDNRTFAQAGYWFDGPGLQRAMAELARAVASDGDTAQARGDFSDLFRGSSVPHSAVDAAFSDLVLAIKDSGVTPADLTAVANDQAAVQTDLRGGSSSGDPDG